MPALILPVPTLLLYSIVGAAVLIYVPFLVVAYGRFQAGYDAAAPRALFDKLPPYAQRATWAHQNSFESFTLYTAAALMAYVTGQSAPLIGWAAIAYLIARTLFSVFYILNIPPLRSLSFGIGSVCIGILLAYSLIGLA